MAVVGCRWGRGGAGDAIEEALAKFDQRQIADDHRDQRG
ncbi:MAG: hypothetical protein QOJ34_2573, partial [Pseudonocardiales bacterium]|nr:hypothetical protein [Pseudonocardiales bacterium]